MDKGTYEQGSLRLIKGIMRGRGHQDISGQKDIFKNHVTVNE